MFKYEIMIKIGNFAKIKSEVINEIEYPNFKKSGIKDRIEINKDNIKITCHRLTDHNLSELLINDSNTIIELIKKTIIYLGFKYKYILEIKQIGIIKYDRYGIVLGPPHSFRENEMNDFLKKKQKLKLEVPNNLNFIFKIKNNNIYYKPYFNACSRYLFGKVQDRDDYLMFSQYWSAFNSIYNIFGKKEFENIKDILSFTSSNIKKFQRTINNFEKIEKEILDFQWKAFCSYKYKPLSNETPDESRVSDIYKKNLLPFLKRKDTALFNKVSQGINAPLGKDNVKLFIFFIQNYVYWLRNNYFHGSEEGLQFSILEYNEHKHLRLIIALFDIYIVELLESYEDLFVFKNTNAAKI